MTGVLSLLLTESLPRLELVLGFPTENEEEQRKCSVWHIHRFVPGSAVTRFRTAVFFHFAFDRGKLCLLWPLGRHCVCSGAAAVGKERTRLEVNRGSDVCVAGLAYTREADAMQGS